jgi:hypothetical protein
MESREEIGVPEGGTAKPDLAAVERVYELIDRDGLMAGIEHLLTFCDEDVELRAYSAQAGVGADGALELLRGREEVRDFFRGRLESGFVLRIRTHGFEVDSDTVRANGSIRVARPDGSFAETSLRWKFHFRDGLVDEVSWEPRAGG